MTTDNHQPAPLPLPAPMARAPWHAPHLLAGRSRAGLMIGGILIAVGALADMIAFKTTLDLLLREPEILSWVMAGGATALALVSAARLGIALAIRRHHDTLYNSFAVAAAAAVWLGLGTAMFLVRWQDSGASGPVFGSAPVQNHEHTLLVAVFFSAVYLISGACTLIEAERLHNPDYSAYRRLRARHSAQVARTAEADATVDRARSAVSQHSGELDREDHRRIAAITARQALGAEAANYARLLMAAMMRDPAKTGITETGPVPELPVSPRRRELPGMTSPEGPHD